MELNRDVTVFIVSIETQISIKTGEHESCIKILARCHICLVNLASMNDNARVRWDPDTRKLVPDSGSLILVVTI